MKAILTYHAIDESRSPISVSAAAWTAHARWFKSGRVRGTSLDDLIGHPEDAGDAIAITFDDGFANIRSALEALRADAIPVTVFVVTRHIGRTNAWGGRDQPGIPTLPLLGWADLEQLAGLGVSMQAHTRTHPALTRCGAAELDDELDGGREDLQAKLGSTPTHIAYPFGDVSENVAARAARSYRFGHTTDLRLLGATEPPMALPRLDVYYFQAPGALEMWGSGHFTGESGGSGRGARCEVRWGWVGPPAGKRPCGRRAVGR